MEDEIDFFEFAEKMSGYEERLPGVEFSLEQKQGLTNTDEIWVLEIFGETKNFLSMQDAFEYLDKIVKEKN